MGGDPEKAFEVMDLDENERHILMQRLQQHYHLRMKQQQQREHLLS
jgi:hypothetical protein